MKWTTLILVLALAGVAWFVLGPPWTFLILMIAALEAVYND